MFVNMFPYILIFAFLSLLLLKKCLIRKSYKTLGSNDAVFKSFYALILPYSEYCFLVWCSASRSHLKLLDCTINNSCCFLPDFLINLKKSRNITRLFIEHEILHKVSIILFIANSLNLQISITRHTVL